MEEIWKDIKGYEGLYQVSSQGRVRSMDRICKHFNGGPQLRKGRILKQHIDRRGYLRTTLSKDGKIKCCQVHRLVAEAFIPNPHNYPMVNHKSEVKTENSVENLEWCDAKYNVNYGTGIERNSNIQKNGARSKPVLQFTKEGYFVKKWPSTKEIERVLGYDNSNISGCCRGKTHYNSAYGYIWKYEV